MEFVKTSDDLKNHYYYRMVSLCGIFQIMIWPVMFGYRVRIGEVGDQYSVMVDTCAGPDREDVNDLYNLYLLAMERIEGPMEIKRLLWVFKSSTIKPYMKDEIFTEGLMAAAGVETKEELQERYKVEIKNLFMIRSGLGKRLKQSSWEMEKY